MAIKRYEFGVNIMLLMFYAVTGGLMLLSAYGAVCVAWGSHPINGYWISVPFGPRAPGMYSFTYVVAINSLGTSNLLLFQVSNILCWILSFSWGAAIYSQLTQRRVTPLLVLFNCVAGFLAGIFPAMIADTNNFTEAFEMGSPHWAKTISSLTVLIVFVMVFVASKVQKKSVLRYTALENAYKGQIAKQLYVVALFLFWLSFVSFIGSTFMKEAHVIQGGFNVWSLVEIQLIGAIATAIAGSTSLGGGMIVSQIQQSKRGVISDIL
jgi:hypothetical protein